MSMRDDFEFSLESLEPGYELHLKSGSKLMLGFGVTTACNYNCPMCFYHASGSGHDKIIHIDLNIVDSILSNIGVLSVVNISLQGEPLLHPAIYEILEISERHSNVIVMCTNGSLLDRKAINMLERIKSLKLAISLDACDQQTYSLMRGKANFHDVIQNVRKAAESLGKRVELNFVLCEQNRGSLQRIPDMTRKLGIRQVNLSLLRETAMTRVNGLVPLKITDALKFAVEIEKRCEEKGVMLNFDASMRAGIACIFPFTYTSILANGSLFPCCGDFKPATVNTYDFEGIFNHPYLKRLRGMLFNGQALPACKKCIQSDV